MEASGDHFWASWSPWGLLPVPPYILCHISSLLPHISHITYQGGPLSSVLWSVGPSSRGCGARLPRPCGVADVARSCRCPPQTPNPKPNHTHVCHLALGSDRPGVLALGLALGPWVLGRLGEWVLDWPPSTLVPRSSELVAHSRFGSKMHQQMLAAAAASAGCRPGDLPWHSGGDLP